MLVSHELVTDAGGFQHPTDVYIAEVWADWKNVHGQEAIIADANGVKVAATVVIRYRSDINLGCAIFKDATVTEIVDEHDVVTGHTVTGTEYEIFSMDDIEERHEYIELKVKRVAGG